MRGLCLPSALNLTISHVLDDQNQNASFPSSLCSQGRRRGPTLGDFYQIVLVLSAQDPFTLFSDKKDTIAQPKGSHCDFLLFLPYCSMWTTGAPLLLLSVCLCEQLAMTHLHYQLFCIFSLSESLMLDICCFLM